MIFQLFSDDLYIATFYMTVAGTFFTATLALLCLFLPKLWGLLKSYQERDENDTIHRWRGGGLAPERQPRLGSTGYLLADIPVGGGGGRGNIGGLGGLGGTGGSYVSARSSLLSCNTLGRMPDDLNVASFPTATSTLTSSQSPEPKPPFRTRGGLDDAAVATLGVDLSDLTNNDLTSQSIVRPVLTRAMTTSQEQGTQTAHPRRRSDALSVTSSGDLDRHSGNPIDLWMSTQLPSRKKLGVGPLSTSKDSASTTGNISGLTHPQFVRGDFSDDTNLGESERLQRLQEEGGGQDQMQLGFRGLLDIHSSSASHGLDSGINRCVSLFLLTPFLFAHMAALEFSIII